MILTYAVSVSDTHSSSTGRLISYSSVVITLLEAFTRCRIGSNGEDFACKLKEKSSSIHFEICIC